MQYCQRKSLSFVYAASLFWFLSNALVMQFSKIDNYSILDWQKGTIYTLYYLKDISIEMFVDFIMLHAWIMHIGTVTFNKDKCSYDFDNITIVQATFHSVTVRIIFNNLVIEQSNVNKNIHRFLRTGSIPPTLSKYIDPRDFIFLFY